MGEVRDRFPSKDVTDSDTPKSTPKTTEDPKVLFKNLYKKALELGINPEDFYQLESLAELKLSKPSTFSKIVKTFLILFCLCFIASVVVLLTEWPITNKQIMEKWFQYYDMDPEKEACAIEASEYLHEVFRLPTKCDFCESVKEVDRISNISQSVFEKRYAYSGRPVIISDAAQNWTALKVFSYHFFKKLYSADSPALQSTESDCQFFGYESEFTSLGEVFDMDDERAQMKNGSKPWYIGWSNCDISVSTILRQHYQKPYFLPRVAESSKLDWIFMGSPGHGANLHIDDVMHPSWQAQITGTKKWRLEPPQECYFHCPYSVEVVVHPGEIIVLDTNRWYHGTLNIGDSISITIGSEFD